MDGHGQIGPEQDNYAADLVALAMALDTNAVVHVKLVDRATKYNLVVARGRALAYMSGLPDGVDDVDRYLMVAHLSQRLGGAALFATDARLTPDYVASKMGYEAIGDGQSVSDFLNRLNRALNLTVVS